MERGFDAVKTGICSNQHLKGPMNRHRRSAYSHGPQERSIGSMMIMFIGLVIVTGGFIIAWLFLADRDLLFATPQQVANPDTAPVLARYRFDTAELVAPTRLVTRVNRRTLGNIVKLDLLLPWPYQPGSIPRLPETSREFNDWIILTFETATKDELTPVERYGEIYPVYFDGEPEQVDGNLLRYKFKETSPYADLTLFVATVEGRHIVHRCDRKPSVLGPILCERTLSLANNMKLRVRFSRSHLENWAQIERNVRLALANMFRTIQPG
jgi:hypothetical protein